MSSVLARMRGKTSLDVLTKAEEIRAEATRLVWNTNIVPKGWRDVFAKPMCRICCDLYDQIKEANEIRATTEGKVQERKQKAQDAINTLGRIYNLIGYLATTLPVDWNRFDNLLTMMVDEEKRLRNWRDSTKLIQPKEKK
ncbi:MAG: hypothetical protein LUD50_02945 [Clostridia bacterium]|nr:hypothetical protein [Clostridia bacterium]